MFLLTFTIRDAWVPSLKLIYTLIQIEEQVYR
jgi:hypothetical protein